MDAQNEDFKKLKTQLKKIKKQYEVSKKRYEIEKIGLKKCPKFQTKICEIQQLLFTIQKQIDITKSKEFTTKKTLVNFKKIKIDENTTNQLNQLYIHEQKINVETLKSVNNMYKLNDFKENVLNQKLNSNNFEENRQSFDDLLKKFALTQSNIENGELKVTQLVEKLLSQNGKSIVNHIVQKRLNMVKKTQINLHKERKKTNVFFSQLLEHKIKVKEAYGDLIEKHYMLKSMKIDHYKNVEMHKTFVQDSKLQHEKNLQHHEKNMNEFIQKIADHDKKVKHFEKNCNKQNKVKLKYTKNFKNLKKKVEILKLKSKEHDDKVTEFQQIADHHDENVKKHQKNVRKHHKKLAKFKKFTSKMLKPVHCEFP